MTATLTSPARVRGYWRSGAIALCSALAAPLFAGDYQVEPFSDLIGENHITQVAPGETLLDIARREKLGQNEIQLANPGIDRWLPAVGSTVLIPDARIIPRGERRGLMLNLPELRLYYFPEQPDAAGFQKVITYPVSVGRMDWVTPLGTARVQSKQKDPAWNPPESVRQEHAAEGDILPAIVPPGPDNPLGAYALRLSLPGYLIHGTNKPFGVGMRVTHGCVRLLPEDIERLFPLVPVNSPVQIVNQPIKLGWQGGDLYIEVHPPLEEDPIAQEDLLRTALDMVYTELQQRPAILDGAQLKRAVSEMSGAAVLISIRALTAPPVIEDSTPLLR